jgi:hypothetical protein
MLWGKLIQLQFFFLKSIFFNFVLKFHLNVKHPMKDVTILSYNIVEKIKINTRLFFNLRVSVELQGCDIFLIFSLSFQVKSKSNFDYWEIVIPFKEGVT